MIIGEDWLAFVGIFLDIIISFSHMYLGDEHGTGSQHVHFKWHIFVNLYFMSFSKPPVCITSIWQFPMWSRGTLIVFKSFCCLKLALNRINFLHFRCRHRCLFGQVLPHWGLLTLPGCVWNHWVPQRCWCQGQYEASAQGDHCYMLPCWHHISWGHPLGGHPY